MTTMHILFCYFKLCDTCWWVLYFSDAPSHFKPYGRQSMHTYSALSAVCALSRSLVLCATTLLLVLQPKQTCSAALVEQFYRVSMFMCVGAYVCMCVCMYGLRIVSLDKILHFVNTLIIIIYLLTVCHSDLGTAVCTTSLHRHSLTVFGGTSWHDRKDSRWQHIKVWKDCFFTGTILDTKQHADFQNRPLF